MFPAALLTLLLLLSITGLPVKAANSLISVPITSRLKFSNVRLQALRDRSKHGKRLTTVPLINNFRGCTIPVDIGEPPTRYNLVLDSGSANIWVRDSMYVPTDTSTPTERIVVSSYGDGYIEGLEFLDTVTVGPGLTVIGQSIAVADEVEGHDGLDGVLGIGPVALTLETLIETPTEPIPTFTNNLRRQHPDTIPAEMVGIFFQPYSGSPLHPAGQLTFGGTDSDLYNGNIAYTPITNSESARDYWGIEQSITYGNTEILRTTSGIVDSGFSLIGIATEAFVLYKAATGGEYHEATELLVISDHQYNALQDLKFNIHGETYTLTRNGQIWPRSLNTMIHGEAGSIYLIVTDFGKGIGEGDYDFVNGYVFMQRFYTVFDTTNHQVGFATTPYTDADTN
ncbi:aspartic proteinase from Irpex Lacteus [Suillus decipiens]|nr:aspartic proteinase from Irpex Lacteus [Suillus decipiens]